MNVNERKKMFKNKIEVHKIIKRDVGFKGSVFELDNYKIKVNKLPKQ